VRTAEGEDLAPLTKLELHRSDPNRQLVDDYAAWFVGEMVYEDGDSDDEEESGNDEESDEEFSGVLEEAQQDSAEFLAATEHAASPCEAAKTEADEETAAWRTARALQTRATIAAERAV
jgi:hypothetical protein